MNIRILFAALLTFSLFTASVIAQPVIVDNSSKYLFRHPHIKKFYVAGALDGAMFSTATIHHDAVVYDPTTGANIPESNTMGTIRFTYFVNFGFTFNFNISPSVGIYTGVDIKNIGYIEQDNGISTKRRTYNVGAPLALKIGDMGDKGSYFFLGGGMDVAINYNEKVFKERDNKTRTNEWWSDRTPRTMPYGFAGISFNHHITVKGQYYFNNYLNTDYRDAQGKAIYQGTEVHLMVLSVGFGMNFTAGEKKHKSNCHHCSDCNDHGHSVGIQM
jgi:hypothetical protein